MDAEHMDSSADSLSPCERLNALLLFTDPFSTIRLFHPHSASHPHPPLLSQLMAMNVMNTPNGKGNQTIPEDILDEVSA